MGELILCSQQLAAMPYYIENVSLNVIRWMNCAIILKIIPVYWMQTLWMTSCVTGWKITAFAGYCTESKEYQGWRRCFV